MSNNAIGVFFVAMTMDIGVVMLDVISIICCVIQVMLGVIDIISGTASGRTICCLKKMGRYFDSI